MLTETAKNNRRILIIDDEQDYVKSLVQLLKIEGYSVFSAADQASAENILNTQSIDLALIDVCLGDKSGIDLIPKIKSIQSDVVCALNTAHGTIETAIQALHSGADDYLQKTAAIDDLLISLERGYKRFVLAQEKKSFEEKLLESEERFRKAFIDAPIGMILTLPDFSIIETNQSFCKMVGYSLNELTGFKITHITHQDSIDSSVEVQKKLFNGEVNKYQGEYRYLHKQGHDIYVSISASLVHDKNKEPLHTIIHVEDITQRKKLDEQLTYQATHDNLTGLINRQEFERRAKRLLTSTQQESSQHAMCYLDLDRFKIVNDTCGHISGDELLRQLSSVIQSVVRKRDTLARLGGDEFGIIMEHCSLKDAYRAADMVRKTVQDYQFFWNERFFKVGVSIGLVSIDNATVNLTELLKDSDSACYIAKDKGGNQVYIYDAKDSEPVARHNEMQWARRLIKAIEEERFCLFSQPIVALDGSSDSHSELLIRMINTKGEIVPPNAFLPAAERYGLISKIDRWVIKTAFDLLINDQSLEDIVSINLSGHSLTNPEILDFIIEKLNQNASVAKRICFEITETAAISDLNTAIKFITTLKELNCQFALDDFGSGLCSFAYLKNLPVDFLKIDGMFVKDIVDNPINYAMVKSINEICQLMGMKTIAEFVENDVIKGMLIDIGVNFAQGYGIGRPRPISWAKRE